MDRRIELENGTAVALSRLHEVLNRLLFLQHSLSALDNGDGLLEGAAGITGDAALAVIDAVNALEKGVGAG